MEQESSAEQPLSLFVLYLMSVSAGLIAANIYYFQPLLNDISAEFDVSQSQASGVALATQLGYACGLLLIIPLGDKIANHRILRWDFLVMIGSLLAVALSGSLWLLITASFFVGLTSAIPQLFVPMAARLANDDDRGRAIGIVMSGLLIGVLGSRVLSGGIGELLGWRTVFYLATAMMFALFVLLTLKLPRLDPTYEGSYFELMRSIGRYFKDEPRLRLAALRGALSFGALSAFWTTLVFLIKNNFGYGSSVAGLFGLLGIGGALAAVQVGKLNDRMGKRKLIIAAIAVMIASWIVFLFSAESIIGIVVGVILIDLGQQALHITNQNIIFAKNPDARNRINTVYMVSFFLGGAGGTILGAIAWEHFQWVGVSVFGLALSAATMLAHLFFAESDSDSADSNTSQSAG
ncbi:MFS transporter [Mariniblastus sp.]|nr:MFS transporter [Mariniblastus sp.]